MTGQRARLGRALIGIATVIQAVACASPPPPRELDLRQMQIVVAQAPTRLDIGGLPGGKAVGAGVGVGTGTGAGALLGVAGCAAAGPLIGLCLAVLVPSTALAGAVTGGVVGAVKTESIAAMERKTRVLREELVATSYPRILAERLQEELLVARKVQVPFALALATLDGALPPGPIEPAPWTLEVAVTELGTEGKSEFALRLVTRITLRRSDRQEIVWTVAKEVQSETELTTSAWLLAGAGAMHTVLDRCVRQAAHELIVDLSRPSDGAAASSHPRSKRSGSCRDIPDDVIKATAS